MREVKPKKESFSVRVSKKVDDFVGIFWPDKAAKRKAFRKAGKMMDRFGSYRGAERNRLNKDWFPGGGSADQDILRELPTLRERSRDLNRNDPHAAGITTTMTSNIVGTGFNPQSWVDREGVGRSVVEVEKFQKQAERIWQKWVPFADAAEVQDFPELLAMINRQILENGEVIVLPLRLKDKNRPYSLALEVIESDRLITPPSKRGDKRVRDGVEIGERTQPINYFIRKTHPGDATFLRQSNPEDYATYPAKNKNGKSNVYHLYWKQRPGQTRGVPFFTPAMNYFKDLADYLEAEIVAARISACFSLFIEKEDAEGAAVINSTSTNSKDQRLEEIEPGMIEYLSPGEKISTFNPNRPGGSFDPFVNRILRAISTSLGLPYELVSKDFSQVNYSSARAALLEARKYFRVWQSWLTRRLCQPVYELLIEEAYLRGEIPAPNFYKNQYDWLRTKWITPGWAWIDPLKEVKAAELAVKNNLSSLSDELAANGKDVDQVLEQRSREEKKKKILGLSEEQLDPKKKVEVIDDKKNGADEVKNNTPGANVDAPRSQPDNKDGTKKGE